MGISTILILLPGLLAFGISKAFSRSRARPINEIVIDLVLQTVFVFLIYFLLVQTEWFDLPSFGEVAVQSFKIKAAVADEILKSAIVVFEKAFCGSVIIAFVVGFSSALANELRMIQRLGRYFWLFQSEADESAWKKTFENGSSECWVHVDTKGGLRYVGLSHSVSWDRKDGGIGLYDVRLFDESTQDLVVVADYIYIPSEELDGPILFVKGKLN